MNSNPKRSIVHCSRRGLAPVEFVLALPILLFVMALMVVFGTAACWKIRAETVSRDSVWRTRYPRLRNQLPDSRADGLTPRPSAWPEDAGFFYQDGDDIEPLMDTALEQPVVSGPLGPVEVDDRLLDFSRGTKIGRATMERDPVMLRNMGSYQFDVANPLIRDAFGFYRMVSWNENRRLPRIYTLPDEGSGRDRMEQALSALQNSPHDWLLRALDNDDEFIQFRGGAPDFHPRFGFRCEMERELYEQQYVPRHVRRVENLPLGMAYAFVNMYQAEVNRMPPRPGVNIADLETKIDQLTNYIESFDPPDSRP